MRALFALLALSIAVPSTADAKKAPKTPRIDKIDRTRAVGAPVLDGEARPGLYIWLEDGALQIAAVPHRDQSKRRTRTYSADLVSTARVTTKRADDFVVRGGGKRVQLTARVASEVARGAVVTEGDVTITASKGVALFVGPLAKRAAKTLRIGRF